MKKASRKNAEINGPDVLADDPVGTMDRFTEGLRRVLSTVKPPPKPPRTKKRRR